MEIAGARKDLQALNVMNAKMVMMNTQTAHIYVKWVMKVTNVKDVCLGIMDIQTAGVSFMV